MHISRVRIAGVRGFSDNRIVDLDLTRPDGSFAGWTVLAGRNGSGKSTVLQSLALALSGPRSTGFIPSLADWMSHGATRAEVRATLSLSALSQMDAQYPAASPNGAAEVWMEFVRSERPGEHEPAEPDFTGAGLDSITSPHNVSSVRSKTFGWLYAGYGAFRHLGNTGTRRAGRSRYSKLAQQVSSLFDETVPLADAIDWLIEQHLYQLENRPGAGHLLEIMMAVLSDGLLPDGFEVRRVDSDGLWVRNDSGEFPLREMSDGYRAVTALVVDIVRQMAAAYPNMKLNWRDGIPELPYPGVILIDEIDAHLHVRWQKVIGQWLKSHFPQIQFIVTTHSPYICQSADPGGLILLPSALEDGPPRILADDLYRRVIYGSGDDAIVSDLFGVATPYSAEAERLRERLADLEIKVLDGAASLAEREEYRALGQTLASSLSTRADEVTARLEREQ
ncbi:MAG TPA: AAA family ATPase [Trebonia sp.]|nr:AAA family ATPase [Trebonia sp.]